MFPVVTRGLDRVTTLLNAMPASSDQVEARKRVDELREKVKIIQERVSLSRITKPLQDHLARFPQNTARVAGLFQKLSEWEGESRAERVRINEELIKSASEGEQCEHMDQAIEALGLVAFLANFIATPIEILVNFASDALGSVMADKGPGDTGAEAFKTSVNLVNVEANNGRLLVGMAPPRHTVQSSSGLFGLLTDLTKMLGERYYGKFCERLEGPLQGKMIGQVSKDGEPYWKFTVGLKGKLSLRYAKSDPGTAIRVRGQFQGFGTDFSVYEDMVRVMFNDTVRKNRAITFHKVITPPVNIYNDWNQLLETQGTIPQTVLSPTAFYIPIEGDLVKNRLTLRIQKARFDFDEDKTAARALYFLIGPAGSEFIDQLLPYKNAYFVITHALSAEQSGTADLNVVVDSAKRTTTVAGDFTREFENKEGGATATYTLSVKACNPTCGQ